MKSCLTKFRSVRPPRPLPAGVLQPAPRSLLWASILGSTAASIAAIEGNPTLAAKLTTDTAAAVAAINAWKSGTPDSEVILALNLVEDDLNLFPSTGPYVPLIDLAIGTVESILALLPQSSSAIAPHAVHRTVVLPFPCPEDRQRLQGPVERYLLF